jgi:hypothetical protein
LRVGVTSSGGWLWVGASASTSPDSWAKEGVAVEVVVDVDGVSSLGALDVTWDRDEWAW